MTKLPPQTILLSMRVPVALAPRITSLVARLSSPKRKAVSR